MQATKEMVKCQGNITANETKLKLQEGQGLLTCSKKNESYNVTFYALFSLI